MISFILGVIVGILIAVVALTTWVIIDMERNANRRDRKDAQRGGSENAKN